MKRVGLLIAVIAICCAMAVPVCAAGEFVPSISYKDHPDVLEPLELVDKDGQPLHELDKHCLEVTPVSEAIDKPEDQRTDAEQLLVEVYEQLTDGSMKIPFEEEDAEDMVIRDLFDASLVCEDMHTDPHHVEELEKPDIHIKISFDLGIPIGTKVVVMTYIDDQWVPAEKVVNNGDGTVTCTFEDICPIAFCVEPGTEDIPPQTGDAYLPRLIFWVIMLVGSAVAIVLLLIPHRKHKHKREK